jgi:hypothetical protein
MHQATLDFLDASQALLTDTGYSPVVGQIYERLRSVFDEQMEKLYEVTKTNPQPRPEPHPMSIGESVRVWYIPEPPPLIPPSEKDLLPPD